MLQKNLYDLKDAGRTWFEHLSHALHLHGFRPSTVDQCIWYKGTTILLVYVDNCLIFDTVQSGLDDIYNFLANRFNITDEGSSITSFLGVKISYSSHPSGQHIHMTQPHLINRIIASIPGMLKANPRTTPAYSTTILT